MPIIIVPAMHEAMFRHQGIMENLTVLKNRGILIVGPRIEEGKAKIADNEEITLHCERELMGKALAGKNVLITSGRCEEPVDDVRVLTTRSSGRMGQELAKAAFRLGATVTIVHRDRIPVVRNIRTDSAASMMAEVTRFFTGNQTDIYISAAAISDYAPERYEGKIPSGQSPVIALTPLPKILDIALTKAKITVAFKLGAGSEADASLLISRGVSLVAANAPDTMGAEAGTYVLLDYAGRKEVSGTKEEIAWQMMSRIVQNHLVTESGEKNTPAPLNYGEPA
jgi:phosphopantothenoylcysteine decarboxylase/phosphopantothenate--cysteine ligase